MTFAASTKGAGMGMHFYEPLQIRGLTLENRLFMAPMCQYSAPDGMVSDWHIRHYVERAIGGVSLVVVEATAVSPEGRISPGDLGIWNDAQQQGLARLVDAIHATGAKVALQLAHSGRKGSSYAPWLGKGSVPASEGGWDVVAPSALAFDPTYSLPVSLDIKGIQRIEEAFAAAARRAVLAGFDAVELHAAHGYLVHQFLSPITNKRTDSYGGNLDGRSRLLRELVPQIRAVLPDSMPFLIRVSATDALEGGWDVNDCIAVLNQVKTEGLDHVDVSSGGLAPGAKMTVGPGYQTGFTASIKVGTGMLTSAVGLISSIEQVEQVLLSGSADAVSLGRILLRDPYWPARHMPAERRRLPSQYLRGF